jgi:membrane associated rhomboid family serine protease
MMGPGHTRVFLKRVAALVGFVVALWIVQAFNWATGDALSATFGLIPRHLSGLDGIVGMPFLHGSFAHLIANTPPLLLLGTLLAATVTRGLVAMNMVVIGFGGTLVWLFGSSAIHIGASGLVFGWFGFLITRGFVDRSPVTLGASVMVGVVYGSIIWGVLPGQPGVSWEAHLFGAIAGIAAAFLIRAHVHAPRLRDVDLR